jgi:Arc/MetJ family transcription regulator
MYNLFILIVTKTTMNLSDELIEKAMQYTGITERTKLVHVALESLIRESSRKKLIQLFGSDKKAKVSLRKRT